MLLGLHKAGNSQGITLLSLPELKSKAHTTWEIQLQGGCTPKRHSVREARPGSDSVTNAPFLGAT